MGPICCNWIDSSYFRKLTPLRCCSTLIIATNSAAVRSVGRSPFPSWLAWPWMAQKNWSTVGHDERWITPKPKIWRILMCLWVCKWWDWFPPNETNRFDWSGSSPPGCDCEPSEGHWLIVSWKFRANRTWKFIYLPIRYEARMNNIIQMNGSGVLRPARYKICTNLIYGLASRAPRISSSAVVCTISCSATTGLGLMPTGFHVSVSVLTPLTALQPSNLDVHAVSDRSIDARHRDD